MLGLTLASLRARPLRALLTALSIVLGVAMISGTFVADRADRPRVLADLRGRQRQERRRRRVAHREQATTAASRSRSRAPCCKRIRHGARRRRGRRARSTRSARWSCSRTASPNAWARAPGRPPLVFSTPPARFDPATYLRGHRADRQRPDRADQGHGQEGPRRDRLDRRTRHAGRPQAPARRRHLHDRHDRVARGRARQLDPARQRPALVFARRQVHAGQRADRAGRIEDDAARPHPHGCSVRAATRCRPARRRPRPTRRASPT